MRISHESDDTAKTHNKRWTFLASHAYRK